MSKTYKKQKYDNNIIAAINKLPLIMKNKEGKLITFRKCLGTETRAEHIAESTHNLQVKDINMVPSILLNPKAKLQDPIHIRRVNYYGYKYKNNKFYRYIKIVTTKVNNDKHEEIITIYLTTKIKK